MCPYFKFYEKCFKLVKEETKTGQSGDLVVTASTPLLATV
jgi:hypothetical protein